MLVGVLLAAYFGFLQQLFFLMRHGVYLKGLIKEYNTVFTDTYKTTQRTAAQNVFRDGQ